MKANILIVCFVFLILVVPGFSMADEVQSDYREFTDIIYEWKPGGTIIQVGNQTISRINSVWLDRGGETLEQVNKSYLKVGKPARVILLGKDKDGFWKAHKIVVFSGKGMEKAMKLLPKIRRKELLKRSD
ncbi:hypothetical protein [Desulfobacter curvatus]|uniref:hypothetical protein n=1 Tax=Desulfobacter curvatus TaxID=2290 RepID=UPI000365AD3A|nr:hypothetical protein [Desulfobacter curvatus]